VRKRPHRHISCHIYQNFVVYLNYSNLTTTRTFMKQTKRVIKIQIPWIQGLFQTDLFLKSKHFPPPISVSPRLDLHPTPGASDRWSPKWIDVDILRRSRSSEQRQSAWDCKYLVQAVVTQNPAAKGTSMSSNVNDHVRQFALTCNPAWLLSLGYHFIFFLVCFVQR